MAKSRYTILPPDQELRSVHYWNAMCLTVPYSGYLVGTAEAKLVDDMLYLSNCEVVPRHRGFGLQRRLIHARVRFAKKLGLEACISYTLPHVTASSNNLYRCGFKLYRPENLWVGEEANYWIREL